MRLDFYLRGAEKLSGEAQHLIEQAAKVELATPVELRALAETIKRIYTGMARGAAPRRSGKLGAEIKGEIKSVPGGFVVSFTSTDYTRYVIEGTGLYHTPDAHDVIRPVKAKALRFEINGRVIFAAFVKGQHPNPFNVKAYERSLPGIQAALKMTGKQILLSFNA